MRVNVLLKALIVGIVAAAFIVPLAMIWGVVKDRSRYRDTVTAEVASTTAQNQTLVGPLVVVRYRERVPAAVKGGVEQVREAAEVLLPDSLAIRSKVRVETRQPGYTACRCSWRLPASRLASRCRHGSASRTNAS